MRDSHPIKLMAEGFTAVIKDFMENYTVSYRHIGKFLGEITVFLFSVMAAIIMGFAVITLIVGIYKLIPVFG